MGKKVNQASTKICKAADHNNNKKQLFNNMINVLKPKVYITDASNFKKLVQQLTGNNYPAISFNPDPPISIPIPIHHQKPVIMPNIIDIDLIQDHDHRRRETSFDSSSSVYSSEASFPTTADQESSPETTTFDVLESSNYAASSFNNIGFPDCGDIESWLLEIDNYCIPPARGVFQQDHLSFCDYDFSELI